MKYFKNLQIRDKGFRKTKNKRNQNKNRRGNISRNRIDKWTKQYSQNSEPVGKPINTIISVIGQLWHRQIRLILNNSVREIHIPARFKDTNIYDDDKEEEKLCVTSQN